MLRILVNKGRENYHPDGVALREEVLQHLRELGVSEGNVHVGLLSFLDHAADAAIQGHKTRVDVALLREQLALVVRPAEALAAREVHDANLQVLGEHPPLDQELEPALGKNLRMIL